MGRAPWAEAALGGRHSLDGFRLRYYANAGLPSALRIEPTTRIVHRQDVFAEKHMMFLSQLVRNGSREFYRTGRTLRC